MHILFIGEIVFGLPMCLTTPWSALLRRAFGLACFFLRRIRSFERTSMQEREMHAAVDRGWPRRSGGLAKKGRTDGLIIGDQNGLSLGRLGTHKFIPSVFVHDMSKMRVCFRSFYECLDISFVCSITLNYNCYTSAAILPCFVSLPVGRCCLPPSFPPLLLFCFKLGRSSGGIFPAAASIRLHTQLC